MAEQLVGVRPSNAHSAGLTRKTTSLRGQHHHPDRGVVEAALEAFAESGPGVTSAPPQGKRRQGEDHERDRDNRWDRGSAADRTRNGRTRTSNRHRDGRKGEAPACT